jgi:hypothetical protein
MGMGAWRGSRRCRRITLAALALVALGLAACGSGDFANDPRPPAQIKVGVKVDAERGAISPNNFGAGVVSFAVNNSSKSPIRLEISGPIHSSSNVIGPGEPGSMQVELPKGDYHASVGPGGAKPGTFTVGAERPSSRDRLLLP